MDLGLKNKRALVLGSSTGIGFAIAQALAGEGAQVVLCARNEKTLTQAAAKIGAKLAIPCDVSKPGACKELVERVVQNLGGIDIVVTNTGGPPKGQFNEITSQAWQDGFQNLWMSVVETVQASLPHMQKQKWGRILLITSAAAKEPIAGLTVSNGLRAGLSNLAKSLSFEIAKDGITVNVILPGYTRTDRLKELKIPEEKITAHIPAGRIGEPEELAAFAAFLASERAAYITGQAIAVDGGALRGI